MIVSAAITWKGATYSLPRPARHHDVIRHIAAVTGATTVGTNEHPDEQGFLDDKGQFYRRKAAMAHAIRCGQLSEGKWGEQLYSEDLW